MRRFRRGTTAILILSIANALLFGLHVLWLSSGASDGARLEPGMPAWQSEGVVVTTIGEGKGALRSGDRVTAVAGHPIAGWVAALGCFQPTCDGLTRPRWQPGEVIRYTVQRDGSPREVAVEMRPYPLAAVVASIWGGLAFAVSTFAIFFWRPYGDRRSRASGRC